MRIERNAKAPFEKAFRSRKADLTQYPFEIGVPIKGDIVNLRQNVFLFEELVSQVSSAFLLEANDEQMPSIARINCRKFEMVAKRLLLQ